MMRLELKLGRGMFILLVIMICVVSVKAQIVIRGTVMDSISKSAIACATILIEQEGVRIGGSYSDEQGKYICRLQDTTGKILKFTAKYIGYQDKVIMVSVPSDTALNMPLVANTESENAEIGSVIIRAVSRPLVEQDINSKTLVSSDIARLPTRNLNCIASTTTQSTTSGISFLGSRTDATVYYVDGVRVIGNTDNESYTKPAENSFKKVKRTPLSTVSIDVDRASYSNIRRYINSKQLPPPDAVRVEEMINYFQYDYPTVQNDEPISRFTQMTACPWNEKHQLLQIGIKGKSLQEGKKPNSNLVFLIDVSGSMQSENKLELVKKSLTLLLDNLLPEDRVAIVVYAGRSALVLPSTAIGTDKVEIIDAIYNLTSGGSTAGGAGIKLAYKTAIDNFIAEGNNRVILCTDGDFNVGISGVGELEKLINEKKESGVFLSVFGFGMGNYKDDQLEVLADKGNGNYAYIDNYKEAKKVS
jgi:Ca-activated chloride channel family protein